VITGTDTGVGKTVLACLFARFFQEQRHPAAVLKPICSGGRADARVLREAQDGRLTLDEINPWHFREGLAPRLAARKEKREVRLAKVLDFIRRTRKRHPCVVVEGAGGLLSPLGTDFDTRDLIVALRAVPIVVCANRLGAINQVLLVLEALPAKYSRRAQVVLTSPERPDASVRGNVATLAEQLGSGRVHELPWMAEPFHAAGAVWNPRIKGMMGRVFRATGAA
jgi:dethiobiotin synthetase